MQEKAEVLHGHETSCFAFGWLSGITVKKVDTKERVAKKCQEMPRNAKSLAMTLAKPEVRR